MNRLKISKEFKNRLIRLYLPIAIIILVGLILSYRNVNYNYSKTVSYSVSYEQELAKILEDAKETNVERLEQKKAKEQAAEQQKNQESLRSEQRSAEDAAANRYTNTYSGSRVYEPLDQCRINGPNPSNKNLVVNFDFNALNSYTPTRVTISTPDGVPLGQIMVKAGSGYVASPSNFFSNATSASFTLTKDNPLYSTYPPTGIVSVYTMCGNHSYYGTIN